MCETCWKERGAPKIKNEKVLKACELILKIYEYNSVGSNMHVQLDDWNLDDHDFGDYSFGFIERNGHECTPEQIGIETECFNLMKSMTLDERASSNALASGYFE